MDTKTFNYSMDGLVFNIVLVEVDGVVTATINVIEGSADFNALVWDNQDDSNFDGFGGRDKSLNMNGAEGSTYDGEDVGWDGGEKLSPAGLGKKGTEKETYIEAGESVSFTLDGLTSLEDLDYFGVRATSTSTPEGSIKAIAVPEEDPVDPGNLGIIFRRGN